jgi:hypothetical protein
MVKAAGGDTDTSCVYEDPDWAQVGAFARGFAERLA